MFSGIVVLRRLDASPTLPNAHTKQLGADVGLAAPCFTLHEDSEHRSRKVPTAGPSEASLLAGRSHGVPHRRLIKSAPFQSVGQCPDSWTMIVIQPFYENFKCIQSKRKSLVTRTCPCPVWITTDIWSFSFYLSRHSSMFTKCIIQRLCCFSFLFSTLLYLAKTGICLWLFDW